MNKGRKEGNRREEENIIIGKYVEKYQRNVEKKEAGITSGCAFSTVHRSISDAETISNC